jgi:carboxyl-terminal processing protease
LINIKKTIKKTIKKIGAAVMAAVMVLSLPITANAYDYQDYLKDAAEVSEYYTDRQRIFELAEVVTTAYPDYWEIDFKYASLFDAVFYLSDNNETFYEDFLSALMSVQKEYLRSTYSVVKTSNKNSENIKAQYLYLENETEKEDLLEAVIDELLEVKPEYTDVIISGIMSFTDQYSRYIKGVDYYTGQVADNVDLGIYPQQLGTAIYVYDVFKGSGADEAGIVKGDFITKINGVPYDSFNPVSLSGAVGSEVILTVLHKNGEQEEITVNRKIYSEGKISSERIDDTVVISFKAFVLLSDAEEFEKYYDEAAADPTVKKLVIDLRGNTGGDSDVLQKIGSVLTPKDTWLFSLVSRDNTEKNISDGKYKGAGKKFGGQLFVLTDGDTASSADILTSVIKNLGGIQVGLPTYAKGIGQSGYILHNGYMAWVTASIIDVPKFGKYHGKPFVPDVQLRNVEPMFEESEILPYGPLFMPLTKYSPTEVIKAYEQRLQAMYRIEIVVDGILDERTMHLTNGAKLAEGLPIIPLNRFEVDIDFLEFTASIADWARMKAATIDVEEDKVLEYCLDYEVKAEKAA